MSAAVVDLHELRRQHGGQLYDGGRRWVGPGPGHSRRDRSLSVALAEDGRALVHSFAGDGFVDCARHVGLEPGAGRSASARDVARERRRRETEAIQRRNETLAFCGRLWRSAAPLEGTPAEPYLIGRGISWLPSDARFLAATPLGYTAMATAPAMLALARDNAGRPKAIQATFFTGEPPTRSRRVTFGSLIGAAVQTAPAGETLAIAEGLESALSYAELEALPTWATLGTANLEAFTPPAGVRRVVIAADGDEAGMKSARALAERLRRRCDVTITPAPIGFDWNDVMSGAVHV